MSNKLKTKDLVTIGIFSVIYFVLFMLVGSAGIIPILYLLFPIPLAIISGVVVMLFMAKAPKKGALFIFGMITPLIMFAMGYPYILPLLALIFMLIAQFIASRGEYKSLKYNTLAYAVFSCWPISSIMQVLLVWESYSKLHTESMGVEWLSAVKGLITYQNLFFVLLGTFVAGLIGAYIGRKMLKKHFERAGIV